MIDLETKYSDILQIANRRVRPASAYLERNATALLRPSNNHQKIGGGQGEIKTVNVLKGLKKATRVLRRPTTGKSDSRWGGGGGASGGRQHKLSLDEGEADPESHPQSPLARKSPVGKQRGRRGSGGMVMDGSLNNSRNFQYSPGALTASPPSGGGGGSGSPHKKAGLSGFLFGRRSATKKEPTNGKDKKFFNEFESPAPRRESARGDDEMDGMELSFVNHHDNIIDTDGSGTGGGDSQEFLSPKPKKKGKEKTTTTKEKKKKRMES